MSCTSIYVACGDAAQQLLNGTKPVMDYEQSGIFTELDVIFIAARCAGGWNEDQMKFAQREASQAVGSLYRTSRVARYGPVQVPGVDELDYMRVASKIVYAPVDGPEAIVTPNGVFRRLTVEDDPIVRKQGRRLGGNRDDLKAWESQEIFAPEPSETPERREIAHLKLSLRAAHQGLHEKDEELHHLRERSAELLTRFEVEELIEARVQSLQERLDSLEGQLA